MRLFDQNLCHHHILAAIPTPSVISVLIPFYEQSKIYENFQTQILDPYDLLIFHKAAN